MRLATICTTILIAGLGLRAEQSGYVHPPLVPGSVIWHDPGPVETLDFAAGPGGKERAPRPPFEFIDELKSGRTVKLKVRDAAGSVWAVKWGHEAKAENVASRLVWAAGYFVLPTYFVEKGTIVGEYELGRASKYVAPDGTFTNARFQLWESRFLKKNNWTWTYNPFIGTRELNGLRVMMMLLSNWDDKDARDSGGLGSNNAIIDARSEGEYRYLVFDWGGTMGKWGFPTLVRNKWDCEGYTAQTKKFVKGVKNGYVEWGLDWTWHDITDGITINDVRWLLERLGRVTDEQLRETLRSSGATPEEIECFRTAIRARIDRLQEITGTSVLSAIERRGTGPPPAVR